MPTDWVCRCATRSGKRAGRSAGLTLGARPGDETRFVNRAAEIWSGLRRRIVNREIVLINDPTLISQLTSRKTSLDSRGRLKLETKEEMRNRGLKSPDRADAVVAAFADGQRVR